MTMCQAWEENTSQLTKLDPQQAKDLALSFPLPTPNQAQVTLYL